MFEAEQSVTPVYFDDCRAVNAYNLGQADGAYELLFPCSVCHMHTHVVSEALVDSPLTHCLG